MSPRIIYMPSGTRARVTPQPLVPGQRDGRQRRGMAMGEPFLLSPDVSQQ